MTNAEDRKRILSAVGKALLDKGEGSSIGQLVAELEGDGTSSDTDPFHVEDKHFYCDVSQVDEWPDEPRDMDSIDEVIDAFEDYWNQFPERRICQIICNAHTVKNGLADFDEGGAHYRKPISELSDEQLTDYCVNRTTEGN